MGPIVKKTVVAINAAEAHTTTVENLVVGYLRRKIRIEPVSFDDDGFHRERVSSKASALVRCISPQASAPAQRAADAFVQRLSHEIRGVRDVNKSKLSPWGKAVARSIDAVHSEAEAKSFIETYLFKFVDVNQSVTDNITRMFTFGNHLEKGVVTYKEFVQDTVVSHSDPVFMRVLHFSKCKSEYGKTVGDWPTAIDKATSTKEAQAIIESFFWTAISAGQDVSKNQMRLEAMHAQLAPKLTKQRGLVEHVFAEVTQPVRLAHDVAWKRRVEDLDRRIESIAQQHKVSVHGPVKPRIALDRMAPHMHFDALSSPSA